MDNRHQIQWGQCVPLLVCLFAAIFGNFFWKDFFRLGPCCLKSSDNDSTLVARFGPIKTYDLRTFLGNPNKGGGPEDLRVVADIPTFIGHHTDVFDYDAATKSLSLRAPIGEQVSGPTTEPDLIKGPRTKTWRTPGQAAPF